MVEEKSLSEKIDKIMENLEENQEKKQFKLPLGIRIFGKGKIKKKNNCIVLIVRTNGQVEIKMLPIEENTVRIGETFHDARAGNVLRYKKLPMLIVPEWNMSPVSPSEGMIAWDPNEDYEKASNKGTLTSAQKLILTKMKLEAIKPKMQFNFKIILILLALAAAVYFGLNYFGAI